MSQPPPYTPNGPPPNPDRRPLPPGWIEQWDSNYKTWFYVNTAENPPRSSWVHPLGPAPPAPQPSGYAPPSGPPPPDNRGYSPYPLKADTTKGITSPLPNNGARLLHHPEDTRVTAALRRRAVIPHTAVARLPRKTGVGSDRTPPSLLRSFSRRLQRSPARGWVPLCWQVR
ncbi:hypothetical protein C8Q77DRAFT_1087004, partial [Trametes polyzona]